MLETRFHFLNTYGKKMSDPTLVPDSVTTSNNAPPSDAVAALEPRKLDPSRIFLDLVFVTYELYVAISESMRATNNKLQDLQSIMRDTITIQGYLQSTETTKTKVNDKEIVYLGGADTDNQAQERANQIMAYLKSIKADQGFVLPANRQIDYAKFTEFRTAVQNNLDILKQSATTKATEADSVVKSANATLDLSTAILKSVSTAMQTVAQNIR